MSIKVTEWVNRHSLVCFYLLAVSTSWSIQVPLALQAQGITRSEIPYALHYLAAYGPMLAAFVVTAVIDGARGISDLLGRVTRWRVGVRGWVLALSPLLAYGLASFGSMFVRGSSISLHELGKIDFLPNLGGGALIFWLLTFGLGEEIGWRGFLLRRLQRDYGELLSAFVVWIFWALWHIPLFFYLYDFSVLPGWVIGLLAGSIVFTWIFNQTGESILIVAVFHGLFNSATACLHCKTGILAPVISTAMMVGAVLIMMFSRRFGGLYKELGLSNTSAEAPIEKR